MRSRLDHREAAVRFVVTCRARRSPSATCSGLGPGLPSRSSGPPAAGQRSATPGRGRPHGRASALLGKPSSWVAMLARSLTTCGFGRRRAGRSCSSARPAQRPPNPLTARPGPDNWTVLNGPTSNVLLSWRASALWNDGTHPSRVSAGADPLVEFCPPDLERRRTFFNPSSTASMLLVPGGAASVRLERYSIADLRRPSATACSTSRECCRRVERGCRASCQHSSCFGDRKRARLAELRSRNEAINARQVDVSELGTVREPRPRGCDSRLAMLGWCER